jgi:osmotically-inducible protein OsmY
VCERLTQHGQINAEDIEIEVNNGQVILRGTVDSRQAKRLAEDVAESVSGVSQIMNQLQVQQRGQQQTEAQSSDQSRTKEMSEGPSA